jgi:hypothetical protein
MKSVERQTTVEDLLRRWQGLKGQHKAATIEDLSVEIAEDPAELRERLQAVASMISFLGIDAQAGSLGPRSIDEAADVRPACRGALDTIGFGGTAMHIGGTAMHIRPGDLLNLGKSLISAIILLNCSLYAIRPFLVHGRLDPGRLDPHS